MHGSTIGGGRVIRVLAPRARKGVAHAEIVAGLAAARSDQRIALDVKTAAFAGVTAADLVRRIGLPAEVLPLDKLVASGELLHAGEHFLHATAVAELEARMIAAPGAAGEIGREELRTQLPAALPPRAYDAILAGLVKKGALVATGDRVAKAAPRLALSALETKLLALFAQWKLEPQRPKELAAALGATEALAKAALDKLIAMKLVARVKPDLMIHAEALAQLRARLVAFLDAHGTIDAQQWKELTGASRKFTIPIAEYFDAEKLTLRVGEVRRKR
jgi:selenocysteine-specific elongation factor